jgi:hypothetical protein
MRVLLKKEYLDLVSRETGDCTLKTEQAECDERSKATEGFST